MGRKGVVESFLVEMERFFVRACLVWFGLDFKWRRGKGEVMTSWVLIPLVLLVVLFVHLVRVCSVTERANCYFGHSCL